MTRNIRKERVLLFIIGKTPLIYLDMSIFLFLTGKSPLILHLLGTQLRTRPITMASGLPLHWIRTLLLYRYPNRREMFAPVSNTCSFSSSIRSSVIRIVGPDTLNAATAFPAWSKIGTAMQVIPTSFSCKSIA